MKFLKPCQICHKRKFQTLEDIYNNTICLRCSESCLKYLAALCQEKNNQIDQYHEVAKALSDKISQYERVNQDYLKEFQIDAESIKSLQELINLYRGFA